MSPWLIGLIVIGTVVIAILAISVFMAYSLTRVNRVPIEKNPADLGLKYEHVSFPSRADNLMLRGWYIPAENSNRWIIIIHGGEQHRADPEINTLDIAKELAHQGYSTLMFDLRGHGESEGKRITMGYHERKDLLGAMDYIRERGIPSERIGLLGFSLGAATALLAAAEDKEVGAVVADSSFADLTELLYPEISKRSGLPKFFAPLIHFAAKLMLGVDVATIKPVDFVAQIAPRPVFFIHGELDEIIPVEHARRLLGASNNPTNELRIVPGAHHVKSYLTQPRDYMSWVVDFFDKALR